MGKHTLTVPSGSGVLAVLAIASTLGFTQDALACGTCRGAAGLGSALTTPDEQWALSFTTMARREVASWDASGRAHGTPLSVVAYDGILQLALGVRLLRVLELSAAAGGGSAWFRAPGLMLDGMGWTDAVTRVRFDVMPEEPLQPTRVASALWLAMRLPTGATSKATAGSTSGLIGAFGLGTWELALGADLRRNFGDHWQPFAAVEGALRLPDQAFGYPRLLGPRAMARAGIIYFVNDALTLSALAEWNFEANVTLRDQIAPNSWQQRTSLLLALGSRMVDGLNTAVSLATDVPVDGIGRNAETTVRLGLTIGYAAMAPVRHACPVPMSGMALRRGNHEPRPPFRPSAL